MHVTPEGELIRWHRPPGDVPVEDAVAPSLRVGNGESDTRPVHREERIGPPVTRGFAVRAMIFAIAARGTNSSTVAPSRSAALLSPSWNRTPRASSVGANEPPFGPRYPYSPSESRIGEHAGPPGREDGDTARALQRLGPRRKRQRAQQGSAAVELQQVGRGPGAPLNDDVLTGRARGERRWGARGLEAHRRRTTERERVQRTGRDVPGEPRAMARALSQYEVEPGSVRLQRDDRALHREHPRACGARVTDVGDGRAGERAGSDDRREDDRTAKRHSPSFRRFADPSTLRAENRRA